MKIITDGFKAMDAMAFAVNEGYSFSETANTITATEKFIPKMKVFQIRTRSIDSDTLNYIRENYLNKPLTITIT